MPRKAENLENTVKKLIAENKRLQTKIARLEAKPMVLPRRQNRTLRTLLFVLGVSAATAILVAGNVLFWAGRTITNTDQYMKSVGPLIEKPAVRSAIADRTTNALFEKVNVEQYVESALPERANFLAPQLTEQLHNATEKQLDNILATEQFQNVWYSVNREAHERFINFSRGYEGDGDIDISDIYTSITRDLQNTKVSFLSGTQLPPKIGSIHVLDSRVVPITHNILMKIDTYRVVAIGSFVLLTVLLIGLVKRKRKALVIVSVAYLTALLVSLISIYIGGRIVAAQVPVAYRAVASEVWASVTTPLALQTASLFIGMLALALIAWFVSRPSSVAAIQARFQKTSEEPSAEVKVQKIASNRRQSTKTRPATSRKKKSNTR